MDNKAAIITRLRRVEGQIKGITKMVSEDKFCGDILVQISAARSALNNAGGLILENYTKDCLGEYIDGDLEDSELEELIDILIRYSKQN